VQANDLTTFERLEDEKASKGLSRAQEKIQS
jgi:hypothetical protein